MVNGTESKKETTPKVPKAKRQPAAKPAKAAKITRRVLGRTRFFQRALSLVTGN